MAISGSGGWTPSVRCTIYRRKLKLTGPIHNVPKSVTHHPEAAAELLVQDHRAFIYVPVAEDGGTVRLNEILVEKGLVDEWQR